MKITECGKVLPNGKEVKYMLGCGIGMGSKIPKNMIYITDDNGIRDSVEIEFEDYSYLRLFCPDYIAISKEEVSKTTIEILKSMRTRG